MKTDPRTRQPAKLRLPRPPKQMEDTVDPGGWLSRRFARKAEEAALRRMEEAFLMSSRYELAFWEMAWKQEEWPI